VIASSIRCIVPGETVYSLIARHGDFGPHTSIRNLSTELFGKSSLSVATDLPRNLRSLASRLPANLGCSEDQLISNHSLFPLFAPFLTADCRAATVTAMLGDGHPHFVMGLAPTRLVSARSLRFCPICMQADIERTGCQIWKCQPQAPGVLWCGVHDLPLVRSTVSPYFLNSSPSLQPARNSVSGQEEYIADKDVGIVQRLAGDVSWLLAENCSYPGPQRLFSFYHARLTSAGYARPDGSIKVGRLCDDLVNFYGQSLLFKLGTALKPAQADNWLMRLARRPRGHQAPLRHLLLIQFLGITVESAIQEATCASDPNRRFVRPHQNRIRNTKRVQRLKGSKRTQWLAVISTNCEGSPRRRHDSLYCWLWRNDREWLRAHQERRPSLRSSRISWCRWDTILSARISKTASRLRQGRSPFIRLSRNRLISCSGKPSWLSSSNPNLPGTSALLASLSETSEAFACRRIRTIAGENLLPSWPPWKLRTFAGVSANLANHGPVSDLLSKLAVEAS
jgi:hypothetical protein